MLRWLSQPWRRLWAFWHYRQLRVLMTERRETVEAWRAHGYDPTKQPGE
jgi:hypothetical protein